MSNELNISLNPFSETSLTLLGKVYAKDGTQQLTTVSMTEVSPALYTGDFPLASVSDGAYSVRFETNTPDKMYGNGVIYVRDNLEVAQDVFFNPSLDEVTTDTASRDASKADVTGLSTFDPANDSVANVTLVDTTTVNTDMRGTNSVPINPLLTDDSRLSNLDATISSRSIFDQSVDEVITDTASRDASKADISALATETNAISNAQSIENRQDEMNEGIKKASKIQPYSGDLT